MLILELLSDGKWHETEELMLSVGLSAREFREIAGFLSKYGFVEVDEENRKLRVDRDFQRLLVQPVT
jgi:predicted transcriptional regulator